MSEKKTKREQAFEMYKNHNGEIDLIKIAQALDAPPGTVRGWKSRYKWDELIGKEEPETKRNATKEKRSATRNVTVDKPPEPVIDNDNLTEARKMFCLYYLQHYNATKAYGQAYPDASYNTAKAHGFTLLQNVEIKKELDRLKATLQQSVHATTSDLLNKLLQQAHADLTDFVEFGTKEYETGKFEEVVTEEIDENGLPIIEKRPVKQKYSYVLLKESDEIDGTMIQEVKQGKDGVSVKLHDGQKALIEVLKRLEVADTNAQGDDVKDWKQQVIDAANRRNEVTDDEN